MNTGSIIDFYDDPYGTVLKTKLAYAQIPECVRKANFQDQEKLASLSDDAFALIMVDNGHKLRKFACVDKGNTALSVLYFMENKDKLPEEAQKVAAANLLAYCEAYGLAAPFSLQKIAACKGADATGSDVMPLQSARNKDEMETDSPISTQKIGATDTDDGEDIQLSKDAGLKRMQRLYRTTLKHTLDPSNGPAAMHPVAKALDRAGAKLENRMQRYGKAVSGTNSPEPYLATVGVTRGPENTHRLHGMPEEDINALTLGMRGTGPVKTGAALYVDVTGKDAPIKLEKVASQRYCLIKEGQGKFPIDSYGQVVEANRWFEEHNKTLHPEERQAFCTKLAARSDELGISVTDKIRKYASSTYASKPEVQIAVSTRMQYWAEDAPERNILNGLMDKYASVQPDVFCEALRQFDESTGISHFWDGAVVDPWLSTFGFEKRAEWQWSQGSERLSEQELVKGVNDADKVHQIKQRFGDEMAKGLAANPKEVFDSLPLDTKRIISRLFSDPQ